MLPNIRHLTELSGDNRFYVTLNVSAYHGGSVHVTSTMEDGLFDTGDIMVHLPIGAFVANTRDMILVP